MNKQNIFPTKGNLIAVKKSLDLASTGYELLDKKRNILIREMMQLLEKVKILRDEITLTFDRAYFSLQEANISNGIVNTIAYTTPIDNSLQLSSRSVMGVEIPNINYEQEDLGIIYGLHTTDSKLDEAFCNFQEVKRLSVVLAEVENSVYRLATAIAKTQKRANALKNIVIPDYEDISKFIQDYLEEKEREEFSRKKVIKTVK